MSDDATKDQGSSRPAASRRKRGPGFSLDALEPRLLLSADPLSFTLVDRFDHDAARADEPAPLSAGLDAVIVSRANAGGGLEQGRNGSDRAGGSIAQDWIEDASSDWQSSRAPGTQDAPPADDWILDEAGPESGTSLTGRVEQASAPGDSSNDRQPSPAAGSTGSIGDGSSTSTGSIAGAGSSIVNRQAGPAAAVPASEDIATPAAADFPVAAAVSGSLTADEGAPAVSAVADAGGFPPGETAEIAGAMSARQTVDADARHQDASFNGPRPGSDPIASRDIADDSLARGPPESTGSHATASRQDELSENTGTGAFDTQSTGTPVSTLTQGQLEGIVAEALKLWSSLDLPDELLDRLFSLQFEITDLPGNAIGRSEDGRILIDAGAAGRGWFVDPTPSDSSEYTAGPEGVLAARPGTAADGRFDLLTTVLHEVGHALGLRHSDEGGQAPELMAAVLVQGQRVLLAATATESDASASGEDPASGGKVVPPNALASWDTASAGPDTPAVTGLLLAGTVLDLSGEAGNLTFTITESGSLIVEGTAGGQWDGEYTGITELVAGAGEDRLLWSTSEERQLTVMGADEGAVGGLTFTGVELLGEDEAAGFNQDSTIEQETVASFDVAVDGGGFLEVEIGGTAAGPGSPNPLDGYDQLNVTGAATLSGTLRVVLVNGFVPTAGSSFDFLTFGSITGAFTTSTGLFGFGDRDLYFDVVVLSDRLQLTVLEVPGGALRITTPSQAQDDALGNVLSDYFSLTAASITGGEISIPGFVDITGDFGIEDTGSQVAIVADNATVVLGNGSFSAGATGAELALLINDDGTRAVYASGAFQLSGGGFLNASGTVTVLQNTTAVSFTNQSVTVGAVTVTIPDLPSGTAARVSGTGLSFDISGFVTVSGNFGFRKSGPIGMEVVEATANMVEATLVAGPVEVGVSNGSLALVLNPDGTKALDATGSLHFVVGGFASASATLVRVKLNDTATDYSSSPLMLDIDGVMATLSAGANTQSVSATGLSFDISGFVTVSGNFGFRKSGPMGMEVVEATANMVEATLVAGPVEVGVTNGSLALVLNPDGTKALDASGSLHFVVGGFASASATLVRVKLNDTATDYSSSPLMLDIDGITATLSAGANTQSVSATGLSFDISGFVTVSGNFGFRKSGPIGMEIVEATANMVEATLVAGPVEVGVTNGSLALVLNPDGTKVLDASGSLHFVVGGFASASATLVRVKLNDTATDYSSSPLMLDIDGITATLSAGASTQSVSATGLSFDISGFVTVSGNFGFRKSGPMGMEVVEATANMVEATLVAGPVEVGVTGGSLALVLNPDGTKALDASGSLHFVVGGFASASASLVRVKLNDTATDYSSSPLMLDIDGITATLSAGANTQSVSATGLSFDISGFVTVSGNFGFRKSGPIGMEVVEATANMVEATLVAGPVEVGVTGGTLA
ncbi:MAG TPA: LEPR-XLL domain-containing protein, partial [Candidatus Polarisedimenticolia bacterium]|nr:LEPR-XLL domain-containing protein [Candidatus Polarisedimenticolia bacterium]